MWKKFDYCCYSCFTDDLDVSNKVVNGLEHKDLKARKIPSFKKYFTIQTYNEESAGVDNGKQKNK